MRLSRRWVFTALALAATVFGVLGYRSTGPRMDGMWGQLFWLTLGVLFTSFLVESLLGRDVEHRRRAEDQFAFRTFAGAMADALLEMVGEAPDARNRVLALAVSTPTVFAAGVRAAAATVHAASAVEPEAYLRGYLDFASGLRNLGTNYIRLLADSRQEMAAVYVGILDVAQRWEYLDALSVRARESLAEALAGSDADAARVGRAQARRSAEEAVALRVVQDSADLLAELAERATRPGVPEAPRS